MALGVTVTTSTAPPVSGAPTNTGTLFAVGRGDIGSQSTYLKVQSISDVITAIGVRSSTNAVLYDALDMYFREGGTVAYIGRVVGATPVNASLALLDSASGTCLTVASSSPGAFANSEQVAVTRTNSATFTATTVSGTPTLSAVSSFANVGVGTPITGTGVPAAATVLSFDSVAGTITMSANSTASASGIVMTPVGFTIILTDAAGNTLLNSGILINTAAAVTWGAAQTLITVTQGASVKSPAALSATSLAGGTDDYGTAALSNWTTALNLFPATLGPGQVTAPAITNTALSGIWSTLLTHAQANNRFAVMDVDAGVTVPGTTANRTAAASAAFAALCARVDRTGNPNQAAAGDSFPLQYVIGLPAVTIAAATMLSNVASITASTLASYGAFITGQAYNTADINTLNAGGVNSFSNINGTLENYGFSTPVPAANDAIFWQASHSRLRMALVANAQAVGRPFTFSQIDGKGNTIAAFGAAISGMLTQFYNAGALYGATPNDAFLVNVGPQVNTSASIAAGVLHAAASVRMSPFAQQVLIDLASIPVTQAVRAA